MLKKGEIYNWSIYRITSPTGRIYIGKSSNVKKRLSNYRNKGNKNQPLIYRSICKYGIENHQIDIIDNFQGDVSYAIDKEMFWIRSYMSNFCKWPEMKGMNLTDGGDGTIGYKASDEHKKKLSEIHKANPSRGMLGKKCSDEKKKRLSEYFKANPSRRKGDYKHTDDSKNKMSQTRTGMPSGRKGKKASDETRLKQSLAKKGKAPWNKGIKLTDDQKKNQHKFKKGEPSWNKGKDYSYLSDDERKEKFGAHNIGNTYNKGRKRSAA